MIVVECMELSGACVMFGGFLVFLLIAVPPEYSFPTREYDANSLYSFECCCMKKPSSALVFLPYKLLLH